MTWQAVHECEPKFSVYNVKKAGFLETFKSLAEEISLRRKSVMEKNADKPIRFDPGGRDAKEVEVWGRFLANKERLLRILKHDDGVMGEV